MALFKMSIVRTQAFERACTACKMAFGCIMHEDAGTMCVAAFENDDEGVIRDTLSEAGSTYIGPWEVV